VNQSDVTDKFNPLMGTLTLQSNGPFIYSNTAIEALAVDGWAVTFGRARSGRSPLSPLLAVPNVTAHPSTTSVPILLYDDPLLCGFNVAIKGLTVQHL